MAKLNLKADYGTVYGHDTIAFVQDGKNFDAKYNELVPEKVKAIVAADLGVAPSADKLANAKAFLLTILKENALSKSVIYKEVENNNQVWNDVRDAAIALGIVKTTQKNLEMWKLPEGAV